MKKQHLAIAAILIIALGAGVFVWQKQGKQVQEQPREEVGANVDKQEQFVTDVDPDVSHWQTKETEFFAIKFPKEWYWLETDLEKTGYHSTVITNNPNFDINKYADISVGTGEDYPLVLKNDSEIVISTNNLGWVTSDAGTPREFMDSLMARLAERYVNSSISCRYASDVNSAPLMVWCSFIDSHNQLVMTYYNSQKKRTFAYSARITQKNGAKISIERILESIAKSFTQKSDF